ncbi:MAG: Ig-like domain-containing protein [Casimicrobiaceae bacterium]
MGSNQVIQIRGFTAPSLTSTTTGVTGAPNPSLVGQSVTLTATVAGASPTGTVQFKDGGANLGAPVTLVGSTASLSTSALTQGTHSITAVYIGDANNTSSTSPVFVQTVNAVGVSVPATSIPTLSDWGIALIALLLGALGVSQLRKRILA